MLKFQTEIQVRLYRESARRRLSVVATLVARTPFRCHSTSGPPIADAPFVANLFLWTCPSVGDL